MRLLYVLPEFPPDHGGGIAMVYGQLLPELTAAGHRITVLLASREHLDQPRYQWQGVEVFPLQSAALAQAQEQMQAWRHHAFLNQFLPLAWAAWSQAQGLGTFEVVEATDWALLYLPWLVQRRSQPVVVSLHGSCGQVDWHGNPDGRRGEGQLVRLLEIAAMPLADRLIANSTLNAEFWWQQCGVRPQVILPIAVQSAVTAVGNARSQRGLVVARLQNWKGPEVLCRALRELPGQQIDWIGQDTPWHESAISTATHLRRQFPDVVDHQLHLLGRLTPEQVRARIQQAAFVCVPSLWDVFNVTVVEAIAEGVPVVCSNQAGAAMLIKHAETGYLFDPKQPSDLSEAIRRLQRLSASQQGMIASMAQIQALTLMRSDQITSKLVREYFLLGCSFRPRELDLWLAHTINNGIDGCFSGKRSQQRRYVLVRPVIWAIRMLKHVWPWSRSRSN
jgi:glycosyltransferase involved in cell wall biosynthesis